MPIHEYIIDKSEGNKYVLDKDNALTEFYVCQDKLKDKSSNSRFPKDINVLMNELKKKNILNNRK